MRTLSALILILAGTTGVLAQGAVAPPSQGPTATQILSGQVAALAEANALCGEGMGKLRLELAAVTRERDELKAQLTK